MSANAETEPANADVGKSSVDWPTFFEENDLHGSGVGQVVMWLDALGKAESESHAKELINEAMDAGDLVVDDSGYYPADRVAGDSGATSVESVSETESPSQQTDTEPSTKPAGAATDLVSSIESLEPDDLDGETVLGLLGECASVIEEQSRELEQKADRIDSLETELESMTALNEAVRRRGKQNKHAVFQLQVRELQAGATLPVEQLDVDALRHDLDLDVEYVGEAEEYIRLADPDAAGDDKNRSGDMPDADEMCQAEQWRQMYRRSFIARDDLEKGEFRAMWLWDDLAKLAVDGGEHHHFVTSAKAKNALVDGGAGPIAGLTPDSKNTATERTMKALAGKHADGVVELVKSDGSLRLRFDLEELKDAQKPLYQSAESDTGDVLVGT